ncbi:hypothetical protein HN51_040542 [Arachis hypogaea]
MSQQKLDLRCQQNIAVCFKNFSPLAPRDGSGGHPMRRQQQHWLYESAKALSQLSSPIHRSNALGSSYGWRAKKKCSCAVAVCRLDAFPSLPGIVLHRKKERRAPARPVVEPKSLSEPYFLQLTRVQQERAAQHNVSCYTESPAGHRGPSSKAMIRRGTDHSFFHWGQVHKRQLQTSHIRRLLTV